MAGSQVRMPRMAVYYPYVHFRDELAEQTLGFRLGNPETAALVLREPLHTLVTSPG